ASLPVPAPAPPPPAEPAPLPAAPAPSLIEDTGSFRPSAPPVALPLRRRTQPAVFLALLAVALVAVPFLPYLQRLRGPVAVQAEAEPRTARASVAVLGFTNLSGNPEAAWLADALS